MVAGAFVYGGMVFEFDFISSLTMRLDGVLTIVLVAVGGCQDTLTGGLTSALVTARHVGWALCARRALRPEVKSAR